MIGELGTCVHWDLLSTSREFMNWVDIKAAQKIAEIFSQSYVRSFYINEEQAQIEWQKPQRRLNESSVMQLLRTESW